MSFDSTSLCPSRVSHWYASIQYSQLETRLVFEIVLVAYLADRLKLRGPLILICLPLTIIGKHLPILDVP